VDASEPRNAGDRRNAVLAAAADAGTTLPPRVLAALTERLGSSTAAASSAIAALLTAAADGEVTEEMVAELVAEGEAASPFTLVDLIEAGDIPGSLSHLERLAGPSSWAPLRTLGLLRNRWVGAWRISCGTEPAPGFAGTQLAKLARKLGPAKLGEGVAHILAAEADIKGASGSTPQAVVEVCVARLARIARSS
jgi:hypothetical protein